MKWFMNTFVDCNEFLSFSNYIFLPCKPLFEDHVIFHNLMMIANVMTPLKLISCVCNFSVPRQHPCSCRVLPRITLGKGAFGVLPTIPVRIPCRVDSLEAESWSRLSSCTRRQTRWTQSFKMKEIPVFSNYTQLVQLISRHWFTWSPQCDALLLVGLADAIVAVAINIVAGVAIMQINIGWAVGVGTSAELWQITGVTGSST